jgi:hypothetical protein
LYICYCVLFSDGAVHISGDIVSREWTTKSVRQWASNDVVCWIISVANDNHLNTEEIDMSRFREIDGPTLYKMSKADFMSIESQCGEILYCTLQGLKREQDQQMPYNLNRREWFVCVCVCVRARASVGACARARKCTLCEGSFHVACSAQNGKMGLAAVVCCTVNVVGQI